MRHKLMIPAVLLILAAVPPPLAAAPWKLTGDFEAHDPALTKEGARWWCYYTGVGIKVIYSDDGLAWNRGTQVFAAELPWWRTYAPNMDQNFPWAPDLFFHNNRWWLYYSVSEWGTNNSAIGLASATSLQAADWRDEGVVIYSKPGVHSYNAIDPSLVVDAAGGFWLVFGSWFDGIRLTAIDKATMKPVNATVYSLATRANGIEGPFIIFRSPYYYLFVSLDNCCAGSNSDYKIAIGRSTSITGPYKDKNGLDMLAGGGTVVHAAGSGSRYKGPGGQSLYGPGLIAHHVYDSLQNGAPKLSISDLFWDANGWPYLSSASGSNGFYRIQNRNSGKFFEVVAARLEDGANIAQWGDTGHPTQEWQLYAWGEGYYRIENRNSHKYAEVIGASRLNGANIAQWANTDHATQEWALVAVGGGYYKLVNRNSGKVAEVKNASTADGANIEQNKYNGGAHQHWILIWQTY